MLTFNRIKTLCLVKKQLAFTLAEVLITLTIIGVIAAITIPNLMQRYQEHVTVNKVKKFYSTLTHAYSQAVKEYGNIDEWNIQGTNENSAKNMYEILIKPYFKIAKYCDGHQSGCVANHYKYLSGERHGTGYANNTSYHSIKLNDGTSFLWRGVINNNYMFAFDVNGEKKPNVIGIDLFLFDVYNGGKIAPRGISSDRCVKKTDDWSCAAWLIYKGNMDYLHCNDLSWNGKNKCK